MLLKKISISFVICIIFLSLILTNKISASEEDVTKVILNDIVENTRETRIYSESAILIEQTTGKILYEKDSHARKYPASTTKILTAIIALERCDLNELQIASEFAVNSIKSGYSTANIKVGETFTIGELINVMLIHSANEAANIIAEHISGSVSEFSKVMNQKAKEIGCTDSNFVNPNGVHDENHYSSAYDLALIGRYCMNNQKFREIVSTMECSLPTTEFWQEPRIFKNTNSLMISDNRYYYPNCIGIKTGFTTPAKNCLVSSSNKNGFETLAVVLHAEATEEGLSARYLDTINLFEYGYNNYDINEILEEYDMIDYEETSRSGYREIGLNNENSNDNNFISEKKVSNFENFVKIILGILIIFLIISYYIIKRILKPQKDKLYRFPIN